MMAQQDHGRPPKSEIQTEGGEGKALPALHRGSGWRQGWTWRSGPNWNEVCLTDWLAAAPLMAKVAAPATPSSVAPTTALIRFEYLCIYGSSLVAVTLNAERE
jgi:hypothetical protein